MVGHSPETDLRHPHDMDVVIFSSIAGIETLRFYSAKVHYLGRLTPLCPHMRCSMIENVYSPFVMPVKTGIQNAKCKPLTATFTYWMPDPRPP
jgi:hypothetical protein